MNAGAAYCVSTALNVKKLIFFATWETSLPSIVAPGLSFLRQTILLMNVAAESIELLKKKEKRINLAVVFSVWEERKRNV